MAEEKSPVIGPVSEEESPEMMGEWEEPTGWVFLVNKSEIIEDLQTVLRTWRLCDNVLDTGTIDAMLSEVFRIHECKDSFAYDEYSNFIIIVPAVRVKTDALVFLHLDEYEKAEKKRVYFIITPGNAEEIEEGTEEFEDINEWFAGFLATGEKIKPAFYYRGGG